MINRWRVIFGGLALVAIACTSKPSPEPTALSTDLLNTSTAQVESTPSATGGTGTLTPGVTPAVETLLPGAPAETSNPLPILETSAPNGTDTAVATPAPVAQPAPSATSVLTVPGHRSAATPSPALSIPTTVPLALAVTASGPRVTINANLYRSLDKSKVRPGDIFKGQAVRAGTPEVPLARAAFLQGVAELNTISPQTKAQYGLLKEIVFSSYQDVQTYIADPQMPADIDYVEYNFEETMTPQAEWVYPAPSVSQFAAIVHSHGKKVSFAPNEALFRRLETTGKLASILKSVDLVVYQGQNQLPRIGESAFVARLAGYHTYVGSYGVPLAVQLWVGRQDCPTMVQVFNAAQSQGSADVMAIGTHHAGAGASCVLSGLRP